MSNKSYLDGLLVDWGSSLFNQKPAAPAKAKKGQTGVLLPPRPSANGGAIGQHGTQANAKAIRNKLGSIVKRTSQVMVKITGGGKGMKQIKDHLDYISRNGKLEVENQEGNIVKGRDELRDLRDEWQHGDFRIAPEGTKREAFNIILSMPAETDALAVKRAARDFAKREFAEHQYAMVLHTFETDPDPNPPRHPHVHLCVKAKSFDGTRLNPRKADLQRWREGFAEALREHGVEAAATNRAQRLQRERGKRKSVQQMKMRGQPQNKVGRSRINQGYVEKAKEIERAVLRNFRGIAKVLDGSEDVEDRKLAVTIVERLSDLYPGLKRETYKKRER